MSKTEIQTKRFLFFRIAAAGTGAGIAALICKYILESAQILHHLLWHQGMLFLPVRLGFILLLMISAYSMYRLLQWHRELAGDCFTRILTVYHYHLPCVWWKELPGTVLGGGAALICGLVIGYESIVLCAGAYLAYGISTLKYWRRYRQVLLETGICVGFAVFFQQPIAALCFFRGIRGKLFAAKNFRPMLLVLFFVYGVNVALGGFRPMFLIPAAANQFRISGHAFLTLLCVILLSGIGMLYIRAYVWIQFLMDRWQKYRFILLQLLFLFSGGFGFFFPLIGGSGSELFYGMMWFYPLGQLGFLFLIKFVFSIFTLACGVPGGFILPVLALGGIGGKLFGEFCCLQGWILPDEINCFILYGMCAMFVSVVRMPVTGIFLILETTWQIQCLPNLLLSGLTAYYLPELLRQSGLYDLLQQRFHARFFARQEGLPMPIDFGEIRQMQNDSMQMKKNMKADPGNSSGNSQ